MPELPPHSVDAEAALLGCILLYPDEAFEAIREAGLTPDWFYENAHRNLYVAIEEFRDAFGDVRDIVVLINHLKSTQRVDDCGGLAYISTLPDKVFSESQAPEYIAILRQQWALRSIERMVERSKLQLQDKPNDWSLVSERLADDIENLRTRANGVPKFVDAASYLSSQLPKPAELIWGLLRRGCRMSIAGGSKSYKSWMLLDLACSVAGKCSWLSIKTTHCPVIFVNLELSEWTVNERVRAICDAKQIKLEPDKLLVFNLRGSKHPFVNHIPTLVHNSRAAGAGLIVIDPIYKIRVGSDEISTADASITMSIIEQVSAKTDTAVVYGQHFSKGNQAAKESIDRLSGSGVYARDPDSILTMTKHREENCYSIEATLRTEKPMPSFVVHWDYPLMRRLDREQADPDDLKRAAGGRPRAAELEDIVGLLKGATTAADWAKAAYNELGISRSSFYRRKLDALAAKLVTQAPDGTYSRTQTPTPS